MYAKMQSSRKMQFFFGRGCQKLKSMQRNTNVPLSFQTLTYVEIGTAGPTFQLCNNSQEKDCGVAYFTVLVKVKRTFDYSKV